MYCRECGAWNEDGDSFCYHCGTPLRKQEELQQKITGKPPLKKEKRKTANIIAAVCLVVAAVGIIAGGTFGLKYWKDRTESRPAVETAAKEQRKEQSTAVKSVPNADRKETEVKSVPNTDRKASGSEEPLKKISGRAQSSAGLSGKLASYKSTVKGYTLFYPKEWENQISITETDSALCIFSKDMEDCASDMEYEQGYWRHACYLLVKVFYDYSDADSCYADSQNPDSEVYADDLLFKRNPARENFHQIPAGENTYAAFMENDAQKSERWLEFEGDDGYNAEIFSERASRYSELVKNLEILMEGFVTGNMGTEN